MLPLEDQLYAFWGCLNEHIYNDEIRNIIYIGKTIERLDLYIRMEYPFDITKKEYIRLMKNLERAPKGTPYRYNTGKWARMALEHAREHRPSEPAEEKAPEKA